MSLDFYRNTPFNPSTKLGLNDTATGTGSTATFNLTNKNGLEMANATQVDATLYLRTISGFTVDTVNNRITLVSTPALNSKIVMPSLYYFPISAFDVDPVQGITNPRVKELPFYIFANDIGIRTYKKLSSLSGVAISLVDQASAGASLNWVQIACADCSGAALTYQATGTTLYTDDIARSSTMAVACITNASSIQVASASSFICGDYITINYSGSSEEVVQILGVNTSTNILTISGTNFPHYIGQYVYTSGRKFWIKLTLPLNVAGGEAFVFFNIAYNKVLQEETRA